MIKKILLAVIAVLFVYGIYHLYKTPEPLITGTSLKCTRPAIQKKENIILRQEKKAEYSTSTKTNLSSEIRIPAIMTWTEGYMNPAPAH